MSKPTWHAKHISMINSAKDAIALIKSGQRIFIGTGCGQPEILTQTLADRARELIDLEIVHLLTSGTAPYATKELSNNFRVNSFFISQNVRDIIQEGLGDYTPIYLSDIPNLFTSGRLPLDVALIQVAPPDEQGFCSLGVSVDIVKSAAENASLVIAQVNTQMPRTTGDTCLHVHDLDILVPVDEPIIEVQSPEPDDDIKRIGEYIAALIDDESTIEFGIGAVPQAVIPFLKNKHDLGVHTEMFSDSIIDLIESGAITGKYKTHDVGKITASFCVGTQRLYDYVDNNPTFSFHPTEYVNDPFIIAQQNKQVAINVALEIDLTGQVCADSIGSKFYSGIGGQVDFNRGAAYSKGGKAIIALPSTARNGTISRISCHLTSGAGVVTTRGDVHYVVTEYGVAYLHGRSVQERALSLISIAHPEFRADLVRQAVEAKFLRPDYAAIKGKVVVGPIESKATQVLDDGTKINIRPMHPTDEPRVKDLFYALSKETIHYRFMSSKKYVNRQEIQDFVFIDHRNDIAVIATLPEAHGEEVLAIGRYCLNAKTNMAEVAFVVHDNWQNRGIGTFLLKHLELIARRNGIKGFTAEVLPQNRAMQRVLAKSENEVIHDPHEDTLSLSYRLNFK